MEQISLLVYLSVTALSGALMFWWLRRKVISVEDQRLNRLEKVKRFHAVLRPRSPFQFSPKQARDEARESIENRFTIIKRALLLAIGLVWSTAMLVPFLHRIPAALISVVTAMCTVMIGMAARPFIENLVAGVVLSFSRHLRIGDTVHIDGHYGTVEDISLTHTIIKRWDWQRYIIPNSRMLTKEMLNLTLHDSVVWAYVEFMVAYESDIQHVQKLAISAMSANPYLAQSESPRFWVMDMKPEGITCWLAGWARSPADAWNLKHETRTNLIMAFREHGIVSHSYQLRPTPPPFMPPEAADLHQPVNADELYQPANSKTA